MPGLWCTLDRWYVGAGDAPEALVLELGQRSEGAFLEASAFLSARPYPTAVGDGGSYHRRVQSPSYCEGSAPGGAN